KGHGLAGAFGSFGGGMAQNLFGAQAGDMLTKITTFTAIAFVFTSLSLAVFSAKRRSSIMQSEKKKAAVEKVREEDSGEKSAVIPEIPSGEQAPLAEEPAVDVEDVQKDISADVEKVKESVPLPVEEEKATVPDE
ncbi:MAG: preprotein translocase subunit SecG, partial [Candidatus Aureabacteria bacterium]|nr:preprotein translocase subunit SecG [Candidatus Auribacterota bacterium]